MGKTDCACDERPIAARRISAHDAYFAARRMRAVALGRILHGLADFAYRVGFGAFRRLADGTHALSLVIALERERTGLLGLTERARKDMGISPSDAELGARRIRRRQGRILWAACCGRKIPNGVRLSP